MDQGYIDALKIEREHYVRTGRKDRVAMVDAELKRCGAAASAAAPAPAPEPVVETAAVEAPETTSRPRAARKAAK